MAPEDLPATSPPGTGTTPSTRPLAAFLPGSSPDPDAILDAFLAWTAEAGFTLYPAQEEALLEVLAERHVILQTPTGSGKSLVALGLHFAALARGRRSVYTSPIKALASEKFFNLCDLFGSTNVGMLTGDASINPGAPIVCCTAEVLANMALRQGEALNISDVVMDEFHYYADPERGVAWQIPLITLPHTRFLLMSATLGDTSLIARRLQDQTFHDVATVQSDERPVPLDWDYRETPIHETVEDLVSNGKAPIYIVNFTQRECAELAQRLTSMQLTTRQEREALRSAIAGFRFDSPYGRELRRFLTFGIGVHHAGLLPKYRLFVEQLAQRGLLKVISGTDTLGVGVNIPIRTVLFTKLAKFDGQKVRILRVRDFQQIAGRAGRKGFDEQGSVVCQAPEHVIEQRIRERKARTGKRRTSRVTRPAKGEVSWSRDTFERLISSQPETLRSRFKLSNGIVVQLLQRDEDANDPDRRNFQTLRDLIARCHEDPATKRRLVGQAAQLVRSLWRAGILTMVQDQSSGYRWVVVNEDLQWDFSLHHALSLYLVEAIAVLDRSSPSYALDVVTFAEAILEDPRVVLYRQVDRAKRELLAQLKAEGVSYEERVARLDEVVYPQPNLELIEQTFEIFRRAHPWIGPDAIRPKSIGREMLEGYISFADYVRLYGLQRFEGVLLRHINQLYKTLLQSVPAWARNDALDDAISTFRDMIETIDRSLLEEWESLLHPELALANRGDVQATYREATIAELTSDPKLFASRARAAMHRLVRALAAGDWEAAAAAVRSEPGNEWTPQRLETVMQPFLQAYGTLVFDAEARLADATRITKTGPLQWNVIQVLHDPQGDNLWYLDAHIDLAVPDAFDGPLVRLDRIGT